MGNHAAGLASSSGHSLEGTEQASTRVEVETLGVGGAGISEDEQYTAPDLRKLIEEQTRKTGVLLLADCHREAGPSTLPSGLLPGMCISHTGLVTPAFFCLLVFGVSL